MSLCLSLSYYCLYLFVFLFMSLSLSSSPFEIDFKTVQHPTTLTTLRTAGAQSKRSSAKTRQALTKQKLLIENDCQKVRSFEQKIMKHCSGWRLGVLCTWGGIRGRGLRCYTYTSGWEIFVGKYTGCRKKMARIGQNGARYPGWPKVAQHCLWVLLKPWLHTVTIIYLDWTTNHR